MQSNSFPLSGRFMLIAAAVLFSTGGAAIKGTTLTNWQVAGFRSLLAALVLPALLPEARGPWNGRHALAGLSYALTLVLFVSATKLTTAANAIFLQSTAPLYLLAAGPWLLKEPVRKADALALLLMAAGMSAIFAGQEPARHTAPDPFTGNLLALLSGVTWAGVLAGLRWLESRQPGSGAATVTAGNLLAFLICLPNLFSAASATPRDALAIVYLGCFQVGLAYVLLSRGLRRVPALEASLLLMLEPALNPLWTFALLGETPSSLAIAGGALILAGALARLRAHRR
jgi:drug/metabolite transporter (DMT)-like permease